MGANPWPYIPPFQSPVEAPISQTQLEPSGQAAHCRDPCSQVLAQSKMGRGRASIISCPELEVVSGASTTAAVTRVHQALCSALTDIINLTHRYLTLALLFLWEKWHSDRANTFLIINTWLDCVSCAFWKAGGKDALWCVYVNNYLSWCSLNFSHFGTTKQFWFYPHSLMLLFHLSFKANYPFYISEVISEGNYMCTIISNQHNLPWIGGNCKHKCSTVKTEYLKF